MQTPSRRGVDLFWIPLGAGGHSVRLNGRIFEAVEAARRHRQRCDLYHAALVLHLDGERYTVENAPRPGGVGSPPRRPTAPVPLRGPLLAWRVDPGPRPGGGGAMPPQQRGADGS